MALILQYGKQERGDMKDLILKMVQSKHIQLKKFQMEDVQKSSTLEGVVDGRTWCDKKNWIGIDCIQQNCENVCWCWSWCLPKVVPF